MPGGSKAEGLGSEVMGMEVISSGRGWWGWAGAAMGWDRCGESGRQWGLQRWGGWGAAASPQGSSEGLGAELHPLLRRCQPR